MAHQVQFRTHIQLANHGNGRRVFGDPCIKDFLFTFTASEQKDFHRRISGKMGNHFLLQFQWINLSRMLGKGSNTDPFLILFRAGNRFYFRKVSFAFSINGREVQQDRKSELFQHISITTERTLLIFHYFMMSANQFLLACPPLTNMGNRYIGKPETQA